MSMIVSFKHVADRPNTIVEVVIGESRLCLEVEEEDLVERMVLFTRLMGVHVGSTLSVSIESTLSTDKYSENEYLMRITENLLKELEGSLQREQLMDGIPSNDHDMPTQSTICVVRQMRGKCDHCSDLEHIRNLRMSDGREPQAIVFQLPPRWNHPEAVLGRNPRTVSPVDNVEDGGSCSGFLMVLAVLVDHLGLRHRKYGAGTVIDDCRVLTAGHIIWCREFGLAQSITVRRDARAGSDGRCVDTGVVHFQWAKDSSAKNDFAILHVSKAFPRGVRRMKYETTPISDDQTGVKIYGFPYDMLRHEDEQTYNQLCFSHSDVHYTCGSPLLCHDGDTEPGNSGGPLVGPSETVIAIHRGSGCKAVEIYENGRKTKKFIRTNKAVAINHNGNDVEKFIKYMAAMLGDLSVQDPRIIRSVNLLHHGWEVSGFGWDENKVTL
ncbi:trypsin-like cysteine/serine peptidase domain-containing protein [Rostrohypoxylon terebratum]|nr:trypsin-like cysteine/serine peptidase domain-containing protein [Rostrohypoxylon terebratum]